MFKLTKEQCEKLIVWQDEQNLKVAQKQGRETPYYGAIGGAYSYTFTPNSLGVVIVVKNLMTGEEINLTDYDW